MAHSRKNAPVPSAKSVAPGRWKGLILVGILLVAATLRLVYLDQVPPPIHVDEAPNAWNAYTLLQTGKDQYGTAWPIFYARAFGDYRTTTYIYALIPFQFFGGMNVWTTRLPAVVGGVLTIMLIYIVGARLLGVATGLTAAAMLALNPWHLQNSRWAHEASLTPLLVMISLTALLWANLPLDDREQRGPKVFPAIVAGFLVAASCYGYAAVRIFLPSFILIAVLMNWRAWRSLLRTPRGSSSVGAMVIVGVALFGPLLWTHITDPAISERAHLLGRVWQESDSMDQRISKVLGRYLGHFGPDFLFLTGDRDPALSPPPGVGLFHWYDLPLMLVGVVMVIRRFKASRSARTLLAWIVVYPAGDVLYPHVSLHALRSLPGMCGLVLIGALGAVTIGEWLWARRQKRLGICSTVAAAAAILILNFRFLGEFYGPDFYRQKSSLIVFATDVLEAARWLRARLGEADAVFVTGQAAHQDIVTLVGLGYDPRQWFRESREVIQGPLPDGRYRNELLYLRYGKIHFLFTDRSIAVLNKLTENDRPDRVILILRPGELGLDRYARPVHEIRNRDGRPTLWIFDLNL